MSATATVTETYTRADVRKVFEKFCADYRLAARATELLSEEDAESTAEDVVAFAEADYVKAVHLVLRQANGAIVRAEEYLVTKTAAGLMDARPGGCIWRPVPGGSLAVVLDPSHTWEALTEQQKGRFRAKLNGSWGPIVFDTTYSGLSRSPARDYVSNGYGLQRSSITGSGG